MKPGIPWSVKGIDQEAREVAKDAARRSGMTLGEWLNSLIKEQAEEAERADPRFRAPSPPPAPKSPAPTPARGSDDITSKLDLLAQQLNTLTRQSTDTAVGQFVAEPEDEAEDSRSVAELVDRVERNEREAATLIGELAERLERIEGIAEDLAQRPKSELPQRPEDVPGYAALEGALRNIIAHIETSETRSRDALKAVHDRLSGLAARAEQAEQSDSERAGTAAPAIAALETKVGDLAQRLNDSDRARRRELEAYIASEVAKLGERIEEARLAGEGAAQKVQSTALQTAQREARELEKRLRAVISEAQKDGAPEMARDMRRVIAAIDSLEQRFDDIKAQTASERDLQSVKLSLEQLAATVAQGSSQRPIAELERRMGELARRIESPQPPSELVAHVGELEMRVQELESRLKEAMQGSNDRVSLQAFEAEFRQAGDRVADVERRLDQLAVLERSVADLYRSLEENRGLTRGEAEEAAREAADRLLREHRPAGPSTELRALESGLQAVRASAEGTDKRTQETLEAVHETLEHIVSRLAELEAGGSAERPKATGPTMPATPVFQVEWPKAPQLTPATVSQADKADLGPSDFDPGPVPEAPASVLGAAETEDSEPAPSEEPVSPAREDFIAAARRAAQATARPQSPIMSGLSSLSARLQPSSAEGKGTADPLTTHKESRFSLPFIGKRRQRADEVEADVPATERKGSVRRRLILAGLVLLVAVAAYAANRTFFADKPGSTGQTQTAPQSSNETVGVRSDRSAKAARESIAARKPTRVAAADLLTTASLGPIPMVGRGTADRLDHDASFSAKSNPEPSSLLSAPVPPASRKPASLPDAEVGTDSLRQAALNGDPNAEFIVASRYLDGRSVAQDLGKAAEWFGRAAEKGLAPAQYRLATLYERGRGVEQSRDAARSWYIRAAGKGNVKSMHNLAVLYADSRQGTPYYELAARWFREAALRGLKDSQYNLAVLNERGLGITANVEEAYLWYMLAAKQGDEDASRKGQALEAAIRPSALLGLKQRIDEWAPQPPVRQANLVAMADPAWQSTTDQAEAAQSQPTESSAAESMANSTALFGKALIRRAQELLAGRGFDVGSADGVMGTKTSNAVRLFQVQNGLPVNGMVSNELVRALESPQS